MNYYSLSVNHSGWAADSRPRIQIVGDWLNDIGFVSGALVQTLPKQDELLFTLSDKNINYSELYNETRQQGGTLNRVYISNTRTLQGLTLVTAGKYISKCGFQFGDTLIAQYEYGCIRVRKVSGNVRLANVARQKNERTGAVEPKIYIFGDWLNDIGFSTDTLVTVAAEQDCITLTAHNKEIIYSEIVKYARKHKMRLIQVGVRQHTTFPLINAKGAYIAKSGFGLDDIFAAYYEYGVIKLQKFDPRRFGFC